MTDSTTDRAADINRKHERIAALLQETGCEGLLCLDPANVSWLTAGGMAKGIVAAAEQPALFFQPLYRWVLCANVDTQRLFDEELDGLGFQLKEWPWHWGRERLLTDLCAGKKIAADTALSNCVDIRQQLQRARLNLSPWEQGVLRELGKSVAHALEATCRNLELGDSEMEIAGQLAHRLVHHGIEPVSILVSSDGRLQKHRRGGPTEVVPRQFCVLQATGRRAGLHASASRVVALGRLPDAVRRDFDLACRYAAVNIACGGPATNPTDILRTSARFLEISGYEHEWRHCPVGWLTGYAPVEEIFRPNEPAPTLEPGMAIVWSAAIGGTSNTDTILITESGPQIVTVPEDWPVKHIKVAGAVTVRPDAFVREA